MKKFLESKLGKILSLVILFAVGGLCLYYGVYLAFPYVSYYGRGVLTFFPVTLVFFFPIFSFVFRWLYLHATGKYNKWKVQYYYSIIGGTFMLSAFIWHIISICLTIGWKLYKGITLLFPFDVLVLALLFLALCILLLVKSIKEHKEVAEEAKMNGVIKTRTKVAFISYAGFAAYFYGGAYFFFSLIGDGYFDVDFFFIVGVALSFLLMFVELALYVIFRHQKAEKKRKAERKQKGPLQ